MASAATSIVKTTICVGVLIQTLMMQNLLYPYGSWSHWMVKFTILHSTLTKEYRSFCLFLGNFPIIYGNLTPEYIYSTFSFFPGTFWPSEIVITCLNFYCFLWNFFSSRKKNNFFFAVSFLFSLSLFTCYLHYITPVIKPVKVEIRKHFNYQTWLSQWYHWN